MILFEWLCLSAAEWLWSVWNKTCSEVIYANEWKGKKTTRRKSHLCTKQYKTLLHSYHTARIYCWEGTSVWFFTHHRMKSIFRKTTKLIFIINKRHIDVFLQPPTHCIHRQLFFLVSFSFFYRAIHSTYTFTPKNG